MSPTKLEHPDVNDVPEIERELAVVAAVAGKVAQANQAARAVECVADALDMLLRLARSLAPKVLTAAVESGAHGVRSAAYDLDDDEFLVTERELYHLLLDDGSLADDQASGQAEQGSQQIRARGRHPVPRMSPDS